MPNATKEWGSCEGPGRDEARTGASFLEVLAWVRCSKAERVVDHTGELCVLASRCVCSLLSSNFFVNTGNAFAHVDTNKLCDFFFFVCDDDVRGSVQFVCREAMLSREAMVQRRALT